MSRVNFGAKPNMYPLPVLIIATYDKDGNPDAMNAAWGVVTDFNEISISMGDHKTTDNLAATGAFTVSMATFDNGILVGEIVNVCADESVLTDGKIDPKKLKPIAFDPVNNTYLAMGDKVGDAFGSGKALK